MIIGKIFDTTGEDILIWRAFHEASGYDCLTCQFKCCHGPYDLPLLDEHRMRIIKERFPLFSIFLRKPRGMNGDEMKCFYHRKNGCFFLKKDGFCYLHDETMSSQPPASLKPLVCQTYPLILRKTRLNESSVRFTYVYPCGSGTGFQWISTNPITDKSIIDHVATVESYYDRCFGDQVDFQDSYQDVNFDILGHYEWVHPFMTSLNEPILDALLIQSDLSSRQFKLMTNEIIDFLSRWYNYPAAVNSKNLDSDAICLDILSKKEISFFNPFSVWYLYNSRLMEITSSHSRWKIGLAALLFSIYHLLLQHGDDIPSSEEYKVSVINEACWTIIHLVLTDLPTLARQNNLNDWKEIGRIFRLLSP